MNPKSQTRADACTGPAIQAMLNRANEALAIGHPGMRAESIIFWKGYAKALTDFSTGVGDQLAAKDAASGGYAQGCSEAAWAGLTVGLESLTTVQIMERFAAQGIQMTTDAASELWLETVLQLPDGVITAVHPDDQHASTRVDVGNGSGQHDEHLVVMGVDIVADQEQGALTLYRANVALPDSMAGQPLQERIVFFEAPEGRQLATVVNILTWAWRAPAEDWLRDGQIYNMWCEKDLYYGSVGEGDTRLFETAWGGAKGVTHANPADIDMFVTPRTRARLDKALQAIAASDKTRSAAAKHMLRRIKEDGRLAYLIDPLTTSYELLTEEVATATGQDVEAFRKQFEASLTFTPWPNKGSNERTRGRFAV